MEKKSQAQRVLEYMEDKRKITTRDAVVDLYIMDLQGCIRDLREEGIPIYSDYVKSKNSRFKIYTLSEQELNKRKELWGQKDA